MNTFNNLKNIYFDEDMIINAMKKVKYPKWILLEIEKMQELLYADDPKMTSMIESYRRGFMKGITATTLNFIENK